MVFLQDLAKNPYFTIPGTFINKTPKKERLKIASALRLKKSRRFRRKLRHILFYFRIESLKRYNKIVDAEIRRLNELPERSQRLLGKPIPNDITRASITRPSFRERILRSIRLAKYMIKKEKQKWPSQDVSSSKKNPKIYRKIRYLYHTGNLFTIRFRPFLEFMNRNYSFLGKGKYLIVLLNSTFIFLLAYLFIFLIRESAIVIAARSFNINAVMRYYDVDFLIRSRDWTVDAVQVVFSTGPLITFMVSLIAIITFSLISNAVWTFRLFIMWTFLSCINSIIWRNDLRFFTKSRIWMGPGISLY